MKNLKEKRYTEDDIRKAFESGFYESAGGDSWYEDHDEDGHLLTDSYCHKLIEDHIKEIDSKDKQP